MKSICKGFSWNNCALQKLYIPLLARSVILHGPHHMDIFITTLHKIFLMFPGRYCFTCHQQTQSLLRATPDTCAVEGREKQEKKKSQNAQNPNHTQHLKPFEEPYLPCIAETAATTRVGWGHHRSSTHTELSQKTTHSLHQRVFLHLTACVKQFPI